MLKQVNVEVKPMNKRKLAVIIVILIIAAAVFLIYPMLTKKENVELKIFHAGSLALMLKEAEEEYEGLNPYIDIVREASGSVKAVRKISDLGKSCDVVMVADYKVIDSYLIPQYADWNLIFCSNEVVLCYTDKSKFAAEINENNWYEILQKTDVKYGFSNPNLDPCGYRSFAILYLASLYYGQENIWTDLVIKYIKNVEVVTNQSGHYLYFPAQPDYVAGGKLMIRDKSVDLVQLLEAGVLDYAFEYRNVAEEHGLKYIMLPSVLSLKEDPYVKTNVILYAGDKEKQRVISISKIRYGLSIPKSCANYDEAVKFLKWLLYSDGKKIIEKHGFTLVQFEFIGPVPSELRG